jgi:hypothetical protein
MSQDILVELVAGSDETDPGEIDRLTQSLREEILLVDEVDSVDAASAGPAPEGTRAVDIAAIGGLVVAAAPTVEAVGKIVRVIREWFARRTQAAPDTTLKMTIGDNSIEISANAEQQEQLVAEFIAAVQRG